MKDLQLDMFREAQQAKTSGMTRAVDHANAVSDRWSERAFSMLLDFLRGLQNNREFMTEQFRQYAYHRGLEAPPSERAFGAIIFRAAKSGLIISTGTGKVSNPKAHQANAAVWRKTGRTADPMTLRTPTPAAQVVIAPIHSAPVRVRESEFYPPPVVGAKNKPFVFNPCVKAFGEGPEGATCRSCCKLVAKSTKQLAKSFGCALRGTTTGSGSHHGASWPACAKYVKIPDKK